MDATDTAHLRAPLAELFVRLTQVISKVEVSAEQRQTLLDLRTRIEEIDRTLASLDADRPSASPGSAPDPHARAPQEDSGRFTVLLVDDDADGRGTMADLLSPYFEVLCAANVIEGARLVREKRPDAVVTDLCMPQADGFALLTTVRSDEETSHVPLLVLSGLSEIEAKVKAFEAGAFDYLTKPVAPVEVIARIRNAIVRSEALRRERMLQSIDDLTGLANRRWLRTFLASALRHSERTRNELSVVMLDQDGLKRINDHYGHAAGDRAIQTLAQALSVSKRGADCAARIGGDEFVVVMPGCDRAGALAFVKRVEEELDRRNILLEGGRTIRVEASFGLACFGDVAWKETAEQLLARADQALYQVKQSRKARGGEERPRSDLTAAVA